MDKTHSNDIQFKEKAIKMIVKHKVKLIIAGAIIVILAIIGIIAKSNRTSSEMLALDDTKSSPIGGNQSKSIGDGDYDVTEAVDHIGEKASVTGTVQKVFTSKSGTVFFDFCDNFQTCTFSAVIFASDIPKFKDIEQYQRKVKITGLIKSYQGKAEIVISGPEQIE